MKSIGEMPCKGQTKNDLNELRNGMDFSDKRPKRITPRSSSSSEIEDMGIMRERSKIVTLYHTARPAERNVSICFMFIFKFSQILLEHFLLFQMFPFLLNTERSMDQ